VNLGRRSAEEVDLRGYLTSQGFEVGAIDPVEPTLEDAFVHLVTQQGGRA
jgi:hypothetical protein